ncbi:MFS transporter [Paenibacillus sp. BSR1-1]|uniref:MFS transporter n=1 Tax=Paenibacillus sp. BSR1-1 TaxID=3020845 RepID=UPI0025B029EF|nr:MFS transporter [Paenibacillus sp. BSR1-1]MDN3016972.1 MFS transporter [Paenibacillus sp. BSR1-1]
MRWLILFSIFVLAVINFADKTITGLAAVPIMHDLNLNYGQWGIVGSSFFWLFSIAGIVGAALSDRIGTGKMLLIMALVWTIAQSIILFVAGLPLLILTRVMLGAGEGPFFATAVSHLSKWFKPESRGFALSILNLGNTIGKAVSVPILVLLIAKLGWREAFFSLGVVSLAFFIFWLWLGRVKPPLTVNEADTVPAKIDWGKTFKILRSPTFVFTTLIAFIGYAVITFSLVFSPAYLTEVKHVSPQTMGYMKAISGSVGAILSVFASVFSDRIYKKTQNVWISRVLLSSICVSAAGVLFYIYTMTNSVPLMIVALIFENAFILLLFTICPIVVNSLLPERKGLMSGIMMGIATTSGIIGPIIFGKVIQGAGANIGFNLNIQVLAVLLVVGAALFTIFARPAHGQANNIQSSNKFTSSVS